MPEIRRLLALAAVPADQRAQALAWSDWRRRHQAGAQRCHQARRTRTQGEAAVTWPVAAERAVLPEPTEAQWAALLALLADADRAAHRSPLPHRPILEGLLWMLAHNRRFEDIPPRYGAYKTIESRYYRWQKRGLWTQLLAILLTPPTECAPI